MITVAMTVYKRTRYTNNTIKSILRNKKNKIDFIILLDKPGENEINKLHELEKNWNDNDGKLSYRIQETNDKINGLWNHLAEMETQENVLVINDDIEISVNYDEALERILNDKNIINPYFFTPYSGGGQMKGHCISGQARAMKKNNLNEILPIDSRIKLYFGDDWIFHRGKENGLLIQWTDAITDFHYTSKTCENSEVVEEARKQIAEDIENWKVILKERNRPDSRFNHIQQNFN